MKILLTYSTITGNTKKVADAIFSVLPEGSEIYNVKDAPSPDNYDLIICGYWVTRANCDPLTERYIKSIKNKTTAIFGTLGADPDSEHANRCKTTVTKALEENGNKVIANFLCRGKVSNAQIEKRRRKYPAGDPRGLTPERMARYAEAALHPNEDDLKNAMEVFGKHI